MAESSPPPEGVSASQANRSCWALPRQMAQGQAFTVLSHGRPVAMLAPDNASREGIGASRRVLLARLATQPASGKPRTWGREEPYD
ncbi:MAG: type II toxin-antitoxin system prevent-host-death family antitoxin [Cyanobacteriota bacterium]